MLLTTINRDGHWMILECSCRCGHRHVRHALQDHEDKAREELCELAGQWIREHFVCACSPNTTPIRRER